MERSSLVDWNGLVDTENGVQWGPEIGDKGFRIRSDKNLRVHSTTAISTLGDVSR